MAMYRPPALNLRTDSGWCTLRKGNRLNLGYYMDILLTFIDCFFFLYGLYIHKKVTEAAILKQIAVLTSLFPQFRDNSDILVFFYILLL